MTVEDQRRTSLVIPVTAPEIQSFRSKHIQTPAALMPPHVSIRGPFFPMEQIDQALRQQLTDFFADHPAFEFTLGTLSRFPHAGVVYLAPEPDRPFQALRRAILEAFPEAPEDAFPHHVMHLTIAQSNTADLGAIEEAFTGDCGQCVPIVAPAKEVQLYEKAGGAWHLRESFALGTR